MSDVLRECLMYFPVGNVIFFRGKLWVSIDAVILIRKTHGATGDLICVLSNFNNLELQKERSTP